MFSFIDFQITELFMYSYYLMQKGEGCADCSGLNFLLQASGCRLFCVEALDWGDWKGCEERAVLGNDWCGVPVMVTMKCVFLGCARKESACFLVVSTLRLQDERGHGVASLMRTKWAPSGSRHCGEDLQSGVQFRALYSAN